MILEEDGKRTNCFLQQKRHQIVNKETADYNIVEFIHVPFTNPKQQISCGEVGITKRLCQWYVSGIIDGGMLYKISFAGSVAG